MRPDIALPERAFAKRFNQIVMATGALPMQQQLVEEKWPLVEAYVRANDLNRIVDADAGGGVGIVAVGKSYADVRQALDYLGLRVPVLFLAVSYPLDCEIVRAPSPEVCGTSTWSRSQALLSKRASKPRCGEWMWRPCTASGTRMGSR